MPKKHGNGGFKKIKSKLTALFYGKYGSVLRSLAAIIIGISIAYPLRPTAENGSVAEALFTDTPLFFFVQIISGQFEFTFSYICKYSFNCMLFIMLGKAVGRLLENKNASNEKLEDIILVPGNMAMMFAISNVLALPPIDKFFSYACDFRLLFTDIEKSIRSSDGSFIMNLLGVLEIAAFFVLLIFWLVLFFFLLKYGIVRFVKSIFISAAYALAFSFIFGMFLGDLLAPVLNFISNHDPLGDIIVAFLIVVTNELLDGKLDSKTDERLDKIPEKIRMYKERRKSKRDVF